LTLKLSLPVFLPFFIMKPTLKHLVRGKVENCRKRKKQRDNKKEKATRVAFWCLLGRSGKRKARNYKREEQKTSSHFSPTHDIQEKGKLLRSILWKEVW